MARRPAAVWRLCHVWTVVLAVWVMHAHTAGGHSTAGGQQLTRPILSEVCPAEQPLNRATFA